MSPRRRVNRGCPAGVLAFGAVALLLIACSGPSGRGQALARRPRIAMIPMGTTHEFWKSIQAGAVTAALELDAELIWKGPLREDDRNEQVQLVETLSASGIDVLILSPIDDRALMRPVAEAKAAGIPTVIFNSALQGGLESAYVSTDNTQGGVVGAERVGELLNGRGRLIMVRVKEGVEGSRNREEGFLRIIREEFPAIEILSDNQYAGTSTETAYQTVENLLARFTGVDAIFTPNESTTFGCLRALQDHGLAGKVIHVGFDSSAKLIEALEKREIRGLVLQDPFAMGFHSVRIALALVRGQSFERLVDTGVFLATPENMNEPGIRRLLAPDLSILDR